jgi:ribosomal protein S18 acetylase RimI-like enzyme
MEAMDSDSHLKLGIVELSDSSMGDILRLHNEIFPIYYNITFFEKLKKSRDRFCFLFSMSQEYVGVCTFKVENRIGYIMTLGIKNEYRRRGLGTSCLRMTEEYLRRKLGAVALHLHVHECNMVALEFYKHCGFEVVGVEPRYYATIMPRSAYRLQKSISSI